MGRDGMLASVRHQVTLEGRTLVVERPYSGKPRLLIGETELPKDRWGNYLLPDEHGNQQKVVIAFDFRHLAPGLQIGERCVLTVPPLPRGAWLLLAPAVILGLFFGGVIGAVLGSAAVMLAAQQLRKPNGSWAKFAAAAGIEIVAVLLPLGVVALMRML